MHGWIYELICVYITMYIWIYMYIYGFICIYGLIYICMDLYLYMDRKNSLARVSRVKALVRRYNYIVHNAWMHRWVDEDMDI